MARYPECNEVTLYLGSNHQAEQLQILYAARGRKLEEVTQQYKGLQDDSDREIRILKHKLTLAQGERDGLTTSLDQCQQMLKEGRQKDADVQGKMSALELQIVALGSAKEQLIKNLQSHESTIESLNAQLMSLEASESLTRARDQHESVVSRLKEKHEAEVYVLKEKIDQAQRNAEEKDQEIDGLRKQVAGLLKTVEDAQINRADTINRLTRSLEDSQTQCQDLLESGSGQELSKIKFQIQEIIASKSITEDMNTALQDEVKELKEQVMMYESVSVFGVLGNTAVSSNPGKPAGFDDSYAQLGIRMSSGAVPSQWQTPDTNRSGTPTMSNDETIHGLKTELERCLHMYKKKTDQIASLQEQLKTIKISLDAHLTRTTQAEQEAIENKEKLKALEDKLGDAITASNPREVLAKKEMEKLTRERDILAAELEEVRSRLEETAANEEKVSELNRDLSSQMAQMITEFDEDKRQALDKCQEAVLQHHEDMRNRLEQDLLTQFSNEKTDLEKQWQEKYNSSASDLGVLQKDLDDVKNMYVVVCREKDQLEEQLGKEYTHNMEQQINELRSKLEEEKQAELDELKTTLSSTTSETLLVVSKEKWVKEQEAEVTRKIETEVARSKTEWFTEHQATRDQAVERSIKVNNLEWQQKWDTELHNQLEKELNNVQDDWNRKKQVEFEKRLDAKLSAAKRVWHDIEIPRQKQKWWDTELHGVVKQVKEEALIQATKEFKRHERSVEEALELARQQWQREKQLESEDSVVLDQSQLDQSQLLEQAQQTCENLKMELDQLKTGKLSQEQGVDNRTASLEQEKLSLEKNLEGKTSEWEAEKVSLEHDLEQRLTDLEAAKHDLEERVSVWETEKARLIEEKRQAIIHVQEQAEQEYKQFLEEHSDTLNKALTTAREQHDYEMEELRKRCDGELEPPRRDSQSPDVDETPTHDRKDLHEQFEGRLSEVTAKQVDEWEARLAEVIANHESEKSHLVALHRENMSKALDEARKRWQKKMEEALEQTDASVLLERERQWEEERAQYVAIINEREQLLQAADNHMETEIAKLHDQLQRQMDPGGGADHRNELFKYEESMQEEYQHHLQENMQQLEDALNAQHEENIREEISRLNEIHKQELSSAESELQADQQREWQQKTEQLDARMRADQEQEKQKLREEMEKAFSERLAKTQTEMEKILSKLEDTRRQLKDLYGKYTKDTKNLARKVELLDHELKKSKAMAEEQQRTIREQHNEKQELNSRVGDLEKQVSKAEKLRQEVVEAMKKSENEHGDIITSYKERCSEMNEKIQRSEAQVKQVKTDLTGKIERSEAQVKLVKAESQQQLLIIQESMERENNSIIENLRAKMVDMNHRHAGEIRKLRQKHEHDKEHHLMETSHKDDSAIHDMRDQYLEAVEKIREDVIKHMSHSNEKAASTVKIQVIRERQLTARRLRRYYMKCLSHMLDKDCDPVTKEHRLMAMERYLDNLPERDSSRSTTPSVGSNNSKTPTPVSITHTVADDARSYEIINSSSELPEHPRRPQNIYSTSSSVSASASSSRPTSGTSRGNDSWVTSRSRGTKPSSMTYPVPSLKSNSPAANGKPPPADQRTVSKRHSRGKSLEQQVEHLRSAFDYSYDLGLSVSTPDLTPRQVGFSDHDTSHNANTDHTLETDDATPRGRDWSVPHHPVTDHTPRDSVPSRHNRSGASDNSQHAVLSVYHGAESPMDDILDKYAIGPTSGRPTSAGEPELPSSAKSTPGRIQFTLPRTDQAHMSHSKSTEFLHRDSQDQPTTPVLSTAKGYRYTSLRNVISKSTSNLHHLPSNSTYTVPSNRLELKTPPPTSIRYKTPPERIPAPQRTRDGPTKPGTPPKPQFVPRLQLQMLDIDLNTSDNPGAITPRADREVANFSAGQASRTRNKAAAPPSLGFKGDHRKLSLQRPVPLVTRQTQAPEAHHSGSRPL